MNIIIDKLPTEYEGLRLNTGFRSSILFELLMQDKELTKDEQIAGAIEIMIENTTEAYKDIPKALNCITKFYTMGKKPKESIPSKKSNNEKLYDYEEDADLIYSAFMKDYKIDLQDIEMHWWKFKSLFNGLDENNQFCKIMGYRSVNLNKIKDKEQKAFYTKMKKQYSLKNENKAENIGDIFW